MDKKELSMSERLARIEMREGISGNEFARRLGISNSDYHNKYKTNHREPTTAWKIALWVIDKYGTKILSKIQNNVPR